MKAARAIQQLFDWKVRGVRWINLIAAALVAAMIFSVYLAKADAASESARIGDLERQIAQNGQRVRLLRAEVARLENPNRLEALSREAGLGPVDVHRRKDEDSLAALAPTPKAPAPAAAPDPAAASDPATGEAPR